MNTRLLPAFLARDELFKSPNSKLHPRKGDLKNYESNSLSSSGFGTVVGTGSLE
jgi:hypothetical protein